MKRTLIVIALLMAATSAMAVGRVTVDPNKLGAKVAAIPSDTDVRLEQKVTVDARRQTVSSILADLSEQSGVTLYAGYNNLDWQVRDRWMNVFATDVPLKSLMDSIAHVMKFKWSRKESNGKWTYRLYMDRRTLLGVDRQRLTEEDRLIQLEDEQRERVVDDLTKAAAMSDEELESLRATDPSLYFHVKMGWAALVPDLLSEVPAAKAAWTSGDLLTFNGADLPAESQKALVRALGMMSGYVTKLYGPKYAVTQEAIDDLSKVSVALNASGLGSGRGGVSFGDVDLEWPAMRMRTSFCDPDSPVVQELGRAYVRLFDGEHVDGQELQRLTLSLEAQTTGFGEPITEHSEDPALAVQVKLKPMGDGFADVLKAVGKASGYAVVSDSFYVFNRGFRPVNSDIQLQAALDKLADQYRYNWDKRGSVLEFRDREWFRKRGYQVPEAWLEPWRKALDKTGTLNIDQLSRIALLDDDQVRENVKSDDVLNVPSLYYVLFLYSDLLRAYQCLDIGQQAALFTEDGLEFGTLSPAQWPTIAKVFRAKPMLTASLDAGLRLMGRREQVGKLTRYTFTATTPKKDSPPAKWEFTTPKYDLAHKIRALPWTGAESQSPDLFRQAQKQTLPDVWLWFKLGVVLYDGKYYEQALDAFGRVIGSEKSNPTLRFAAHTWRGHMLDLTDHRDDAVAAYKEALKIEKSEPVSHDQYDLVIDRKWVEERLKTPFKRE